jgi:putative PIN family toxin of toxin-antitoxin system
MKSSKEKEQDSGRKRLRIFVDANTIVSGLVFEANEGLLMKLGAVGACSLVTTRYVMDEVSHVLRAREFGLSEDETQSLLSLTNRSVTVYGNTKSADLHQYFGRLNDEKDIHVLADFEKLKCDVLVTGDKELLEKVPGAKTTRQMLNMLLTKL